MSPESYAIAGVVVGGLLAVGGQILNSAMQRRWSQMDMRLQLAKEQRSRIFDHSRVAHTGFLTAVTSLRNSLHGYVTVGYGTPPPDDVFDELYVKLTEVQVFGGGQTPDLAEEVFVAINNWYTSSTDEAEDADADLQRCVESYVEAVRRDLSVPDQADNTLAPKD